MSHPLRQLPSVSALLDRPEIMTRAAMTPRPVLVNAIRAAIARVRESGQSLPDPNQWPALVARELELSSMSSMPPVINATGVVLHTNLGRAPLADEAVAAIIGAAGGYTALEFELDSGQRGSRHEHCVSLLRELTGAESAFVVNNCAAALVLALNTLAAHRPVVISRGELIEIGGSFRIPDIMERSTARLVEVGTTNRTHLLDYRASVTEQTAAIVKVHRSNFAVSGFVADVPLRELAQLATDRNVPLLFDLGGGLLIDLERYGFPAEPTARHAIAEGADLVVFSGDKLLGGPQAGIVVGRAAMVDRMRANPLARALRSDKLTLAALEATLRLYRDPALAVRRVPTLAMLTADQSQVRARADRIAAKLAQHGHHVGVVQSTAAVGAGAFPTHEIPSAALEVARDAGAVATRLRTGSTPVVARLHDGRLLLDLRTVRDQEEDGLIAALRDALAA